MMSGEISRARVFGRMASMATVMFSFALACGAAVAQSTGTSGQVTITASGVVKHKQVGVSYTGMPIEQLDLTRRVSYRDLNLRTAAGQDKLKHRIDYTAREACKQLTALYPFALWRTSQADCVHRAIDSAMAEVPTAVAAAERHAEGRRE